MAAAKKKKNTSEDKVLGLLNAYRIACREYDDVDSRNIYGAEGRAAEKLRNIKQKRIVDVTRQIVNLLSD